MKLLDSVCQIYDDTIWYNLSRMNVMTLLHLVKTILILMKAI